MEHVLNNLIPVKIDFSGKTCNEKIEIIKQLVLKCSGITFGYLVYKNFYSDEMSKTGMMLMPEKNEEPIGANCGAIVGFDDEKRCFLVMNSWGKDWGIDGCFYAGYDFVGDGEKACDFWYVDRSVLGG